MDNYLNRSRFIRYYTTMAGLEASQLHGQSRIASSRHLKDFTTRMRFNDEVDKFIASQLQGIKKAKNDSECLICLQNLQQEKRFIAEQDEKLRLGNAKLYATVELEKKLDDSNATGS